MSVTYSGKSDPYVEVYLGSQLLHKTSKKKNTLNPEWNEQFHAEHKGVLTFKVTSYFRRNSWQLYYAGH